MAVTIDHEGPAPLYQQLAQILRDQIASGELPPNRPIPAESRLQQIHGVGRDTARKAVAILREEGLVFTVQAKGTYVSPPAETTTGESTGE